MRRQKFGQGCVQKKKHAWIRLGTGQEAGAVLLSLLPLPPRTACYPQVGPLHREWGQSCQAQCLPPSRDSKTKSTPSSPSLLYIGAALPSIHSRAPTWGGGYGYVSPTSAHIYHHSFMKMAQEQPPDLLLACPGCGPGDSAGSLSGQL